MTDFQKYIQLFRETGVKYSLGAVGIEVFIQLKLENDIIVQFIFNDTGKFLNIET